MAKTHEILFVTVGGIKWAWRSPPKKYDGLMEALGVKKGKDTDIGLVFGCNNPRPARVNINLKNGKVLKRYCDPDNVSKLVVKKTLNGKKYAGVDIDSVTLAK